MIVKFMKNIFKNIKKLLKCYKIQKKYKTIYIYKLQKCMNYEK